MMIFPLNKNSLKQQTKIGGFTLVELIVVIVLLAIISVYASSKYMGASRFSSAAAQEQVLSILRQVQITAMQSNTSNNSNRCRSILMASNQFGVTQACQSQGMSSTALSDYSKNTNPQQLELIQLSYDFNSVSGAVSELSFDLLGRPAVVTSSAITPLCTDSDCRITITTPSSNESRSVCINREGFIYRSVQDKGCGL
ncbi:type II secretion system protein [Aliivibrio sp. S3MY1]|uniref:type II secretion system protein n=1 Tax=unclassified Aliivibrio TaxID=2645654 RepID=UPI0023789725|nr:MULTISPECIES: type II secretion system protein [unclassified Aliivibrio]MDD9197085.1 type II secretion system protein [Aliivibrio sp. S3MY1]MDD9200195.1 type II secretion system protein [Aliivibrio sp. S2MY1]